MIRIRKRSNVMAATAMLGLVASACGGGSAGGNGHSPSSTSKPAPTNAAVLDAYRTTSAAGSVQFSMVMSANGPGLSLTMNGTGAASKTNNASQVDLTVPAQGTTQVRTVGTAMYMQLPQTAAASLNVHTPWVMVDLSKLPGSTLAGSQLGNYRQGAQAQQSLAMLQGMSTTGIHEVGHALVRGVATTEYKTTIDVAKLGQTALKSSVVEKELAASHVSTIPVTVWIDSHGRVRQMTWSAALALPASSGSQTTGTTPAQKMTISTTLDLYKFNSPVTITAPPSSQTTNITATIASAAHGQAAGGNTAAG